MAQQEPELEPRLPSDARSPFETPPPAGPVPGALAALPVTPETEDTTIQAASPAAFGGSAPPPGWVGAPEADSLAGGLAGPAHRVETARPAASRRWILFLVLGVVFLAAGVAALVWLFQGRPPAGLALAARFAPVETDAVWAVENPAAVLAALKQASVRNDALDGLGEAFQEAYGFDPLKPENWARAGFDANSPVCVALTSRRRGVESLVHFGLVNESAALATLKAAGDRSQWNLEKVEAPYPLYRVRFREGPGGEGQVGGVAYAMKDRRLFALRCKNLDVEKAGRAVSRLEEILNLKPVETLAEDPDFRHDVSQLSGADYASAYARLSSREIQRELRGFRLLGDVRGIAAALGRGGSTVFLGLEKGALALDILKPGGVCADVLARFEPPLAAVSWSLDNPVDALRQSLPRDGVDEVRRTFDRMGLSLSDLEELTAKGAGALLLYLAPNDDRPSFVAAVRVNDAEKAQRLLRRLADEADLERKTAGEAVIFVRRSGERDQFAVGLFGSCVVAGSAVDKILRAARGGGGSWAPRCGGANPFALHVFPARLSDVFFRDREPGLAFRIDRNAEVYGTLDLKGGGVRLSLTDGTGSLLPLALAFLAENMPAVERPSSRQTRAASMLRNIGSAEVAFSCKIGNEGKYGNLAELAAQSFLDSRFASGRAVIDGFEFSATSGEGTFLASAIGVGSFAGITLYINQSLVLSTDPACTTPWTEDVRPATQIVESSGPSPRVSAVALLRIIASAEAAYSAKAGNNGKYGSLAELAAQGFLDNRFLPGAVVIDGYRYSGSFSGTAFTVAAQGQGPYSGTDFYVNQTGVVFADPACKRPVGP